jgi:hypothetical protein
VCCLLFSCLFCRYCYEESRVGNLAYMIPHQLGRSSRGGQLCVSWPFEPHWISVWHQRLRHSILVYHGQQKVTRLLPFLSGLNTEFQYFNTALKSSVYLLFYRIFIQIYGVMDDCEQEVQHEYVLMRKMRMCWGCVIIREGWVKIRRVTK